MIMKTELKHVNDPYHKYSISIYAQVENWTVVSYDDYTEEGFYIHHLPCNNLGSIWRVYNKPVGFSVSNKCMKCGSSTPDKIQFIYKMLEIKI